MAEKTDNLSDNIPKIKADCRFATIPNELKVPNKGRNINIDIKMLYLTGFVNRYMDMNFMNESI